MSQKQKLIASISAAILLITIPLTIALISKQQNTRSRAAASTTLYFEPSSTTTSPIVKNVGDPIDLDMYVDPGANMVTFVRYQVTFDPSKVQIVSPNPISLNTSVFTSVEGPVAGNGTVAQSISIGSDPTKAIQQKTKIGTLHFKALTATGDNPTALIFGNLTQSLSSGNGDQAGQNILSSTTPATIQINGTTGTITPGVSTATPPSTTLTPQPSLSGMILAFTVVLHGVGAGGDNPNPGGNSLSNKNPLHPQRNLTVEVINTDNQVVATSSAPVSFTPDGNFSAKISLGKSVPDGNYNVRVKTDRYLRRLVPGIQQLKNNQENTMPVTQLIAGDTNGDNVLNVIDYNALLDCGYGKITPLPMSDANAPYNTKECQAHTPSENVDIDDNGVINSYDYNLFIRELSVQNGD